jgi:hypothetical protein
MPPLKLGILLDSWEIPAWQYVMLENIRRSNYADLSLVVLNRAGAPRRRGARRWLRIPGRALQGLLWKVIQRVESGLKCAPDAFALRDARALLGGAFVLEVAPLRSGFWDVFADADVRSIRGHAPDVLVRLGFRILKGGILGSAKHGIWSFHHGDDHTKRGGPPGFWEVYENDPVTGSVLQILTEQLDAGTILHRSFSATINTSDRLNRNRVYWKTLAFLPRKLAELHRDGADTFFRKVEDAQAVPAHPPGRVYRMPTARQLAVYLFRTTTRRARNLVSRLVGTPQWVLEFGFGEKVSPAFSRLTPPPDRFWADPHVLLRNGRYYLFLEEYRYAEQRGRICLAVLDAAGNLEEGPVPVLERDYHLSYPCVFEHDGEWYMIPETSANRTIELYRCAEFPKKWELVETLMEGVRAVDTTVFRQDGRWWLFTSMVENPGASSCDELFLFHSPSLLRGEWTSHPMNPVVSDARAARPGGAVQRLGERIFRPAQDCSRGYGRALSLREITRLSPTDYAEVERERLEPGWRADVKAVHSLARAGGLTVVDALRHRPRWKRG